MIDNSVELDDDDLDLFCILDAEPERTLETRCPALAWKNLERAGAVRILHLRGRRDRITAIVEPEELDL